MKQVIQEEGARPIKIFTHDVEETALQQLKNVAGLPFIHPNGIAAMPDVHAGKGATIGSVIPTINAIIPAAVGVDIGCGMNAVRTSLRATDLPDELKTLRREIERRVPVGMGRDGEHTSRTIVSNSAGNALYSELAFDNSWWYRVTDGKEKVQLQLIHKMGDQLGTLGSGNHFIELCLDEDGFVWVMLHSGSRGIGNFIGTHFIEKARRAMEMYHIHLPDRDLAYLPDGTQDFTDYVAAVDWGQRYALANRADMMARVLGVLRDLIPVPFTITDEGANCHHNYIERENHFGKNVWVTRKGAIRAREGDLGIIPGSMGTKSFIVRGKGNPDSYCSCSHGAGRKMSRSAARRAFTKADLEAQTMGVECRKDEGILDEIPGSYKDIDVVMENSADLVEIVHTLKAILCVKGA
jgi:tRNA-splicing ligase RtcB